MSRSTRATRANPPQQDNAEESGGDEEPNVDLQDLVAQLQQRLAEQDAELRLLRNRDNITRRKRVSPAPGDLLPTPIQLYDANLNCNIHKTYKAADAYADKFAGNGKTS